jgi:hypothetical protein
MNRGLAKWGRAGIAVLALAAVTGCGGYSDSEKVNTPTPTPTSATPTPTPTPSGPRVPATPAASCPSIADPQGLTNAGTITGPTGTYRVCVLPSLVTVSTRLPRIAGVLYELPGRVDIGRDSGPTATASDTNVTLTIDAGVVVFGVDASWLAVNRGNKLQAIGTAAAPIVFTSRDNVLGTNLDNSSGQWGGVVLMGRAPISDCATTGATPGTASCQAQTEGAVDPARYGGGTPADSSGRLSYVQIRYSGFVLSANQELQALTAEGVGSGTVLDHIMSYNSSDDAVEIFGGRVNMKYLVAVGAEDDSIDTDSGTKANLQYVLAVQRPGFGDSLIEADTDDASFPQVPRQNTLLANFTLIDRSSNAASNRASMLLRGGTDYTMANGILVSSANPCLRINGVQTASTTVDPAADEAGPPLFRSVVMQCGTPHYIGTGGVTDSVVALLFGNGANNNSDAFTPTLTGSYINGANETGVLAYDVRTLSSFFDTTSYIGAVRDAADRWYAGWTCNSSAADFGANNTGVCTSLPVI